MAINKRITLTVKYIDPLHIIKLAMHAHLQGLVDDLLEQRGESTQILGYQHLRLLPKLAAIEKHALAKAIVEWNWDVGSVILMKFLQQSNVLNMTDVFYYTYQQDPNHAQLILSDLLETEFTLLADLVKHINSSDATAIAICDVLNEGFKRLCIDIVEHPNILMQDYIKAVDYYVQDDCMDTMRQIHLNLLLQECPDYAITDALSTQSEWTEEITKSSDIFKSFLSSVVGSTFVSQKITLNTLLERCLDTTFRKWKYLLWFIRFSLVPKLNDDQRNEVRILIKDFLKRVFNSIFEDDGQYSVFISFVVAREIIHSSPDIIGNYSTWFKNTFGEMKYYLKKDRFELAVDKLSRVVEFESDSTILAVHIETYMPAPVRCGDLVDNYKQLCRSRLAHLCNESTKANVSAQEEMEVYVIDD